MGEIETAGCRCLLRSGTSALRRSASVLARRNVPEHEGERLAERVALANQRYPERPVVVACCARGRARSGGVRASSLAEMSLSTRGSGWRKGWHWRIGGIQSAGLSLLAALRDERTPAECERPRSQKGP
jgi:hypothetical protein